MVQNLDAFKDLIKRYNTITLGELQIIEEEVGICDTANAATGFGCTRSCTLCVACSVESYDIRIPDCSTCVWSDYGSDETWCDMQGNRDTYLAIRDARTVEELLEAYHARALHMSVFLEYKDRP